MLMKQGVFMSVVGIGMLLVVGGLAGCGEETQVAAVNGPPARPLQTGQASCYDASGSSPNTIPCAGTGQDGATQTGVARRYIDNGDGTITDASTGLMWEKKSADGSLHDQGNVYSWSDAFAVFITGLNSARFAGHSDWRLPNVNELQSIVNYGTSSSAVDAVFNTSCAASCTVTTCSCTQSSYYWSSTTYQYYPPYAWSVGFSDGGVYYSVKSLTGYVRAVRGGS
jgi:hypothetical protein